MLRFECLWTSLRPTAPPLEPQIDELLRSMELQKSDVVHIYYDVQPEANHFGICIIYDDGK